MLKPHEKPNRLPPEQEVAGSTPAAGTNRIKRLASRTVMTRVRNNPFGNPIAFMPTPKVERAPFGYTRSRTGKLKVSEAQAAIVRYIFRSFIAGQSPSQIAAQLNAGKAPHPLRSTLAWHAATVARILGDSIYAGTKEAPAIISAEDWARSRRTTAQANPITDALCDVLVCSYCEGGFDLTKTTGPKGRTYRYYYCASRERESCRNIAIAADQLHTVVGRLMSDNSYRGMDPVDFVRDRISRIVVSTESQRGREQPRVAIHMKS